ncbi:IclR family transcriptional regulator [Pontivivens ytuae]|uniref:IclR family transcriptional regulator n=1 Tax=Pontivivens ytuae TaxID=2789856 RepID=A0A7S9LUS2_9RHOB|nr:IclR family transcriptional regulator [Pontivivens ytuae]QPH55644.1 IclR family transcriptional regulator [Pontivivens ytuae]
MTDQSPTRGRGVQSVEVSVNLLTALARHPGPMALSQLAAEVGMAPAKVHRYLASFVETGMVQHRRSGSYDLGPRAAEIGTAAIARIDPVNRAADALPELVEATGFTALLAVWGNLGPTIVRWEKAAVPLVTMLGLGSVLPVTRSATGHAFMAHMPDRLLTDVVAAEAPERTLEDFGDLRMSVREAGLAMADQDFIPGLFALAAPILDLQSRPAAVVTLISTTRDLLDEEHPARMRLVAFAAS